MGSVGFFALLSTFAPVLVWLLWIQQQGADMLSMFSCLGCWKVEWS
jgi:hypothetical protein